jgi:hypothetical protein
VIEHAAFAAVVKLAVAFEPGDTGDVTDRAVVVGAAAVGGAVGGAAVRTGVGLGGLTVGPALTLVAPGLEAPHPVSTRLAGTKSKSAMSSFFIGLRRTLHSQRTTVLMSDSGLRRPCTGRPYRTDHPARRRGLLVLERPQFVRLAPR